MGENTEKEHCFMSVVLHAFYSGCTVSLFYSTNIYYTSSNSLQSFLEVILKSALFLIVQPLPSRMKLVHLWHKSKTITIAGFFIF